MWGRENLIAMKPSLGFIFHCFVVQGESPAPWRKLSALEENAESVADDPERRLDDRPSRVCRRSDDTVGLIAAGGGRGGGFRGRVIAGIAARRVGCLAARVRTGLE